MAGIHVRDVPGEVHAALAEQARERHLSLQKYALEVLAAAARRGRNAGLFAEVEDNLARGGGYAAAPGETEAELAASREEHEERMVQAP